MPRIDPIQLLKCLSVLLSPNGGIKSGDEVRRLASLMTKFSKKLVSKCIYIQILKCTETELLGMFMISGGWKLVHMWLTESIVSKNWPLVKELLELLLLCPVDIERLKTNNCPKLVKELSKDGNHLAIRALASKLVEQWLKTVKGESVVPISITEIPQIIADANLNTNLDAGFAKSEPYLDLEDTMISEIEHKNEGELKDVENKTNLTIETKNENLNTEVENQLKEDNDLPPETVPVLKISLKDGKQVVSESKDCDKKTDKDRTKEKHRSKDRSSSDKSGSSKSSSSKHKSHTSTDKKSSNDSPSSHRSKDKERSKDKDKEKHSSHSSKSSKHSDSSRRSSSSSTKSSREDKSKDSRKDSKSRDDKSSKDSSRTNKQNEKSDQPSIQKLGKIPKLSDSKKEKPSISIEVRKPDEPKPKTVKTFHSRFRKHGLEEEVKPPPSRATLLNKKAPPALPPTVSIPKRPSPVHNETPPEKKAKTIEIIDKPGAIKLIPPKPKPMMLLESDMFMDALNASATNKKEPKKRKRRTSGSRDGNPSSDGSPPNTPTTPAAGSSPSGRPSDGPGPAEPRELRHAPPRFYKDTLDTDDDKDKSFERESDHNDNSESASIKSADKDSADNNESHVSIVNGLRGVLCYHKRKGPKKSIKWKPEAELEEIQYFELDETERVNVTKTFTDMKHLERIHEREAFQKGRNTSTDDVMEEKTSWRPLIPFDAEGQIPVEYGKHSKEKDIQAIRQKGTLQPLYFHKSMIPDSPVEPEVETHTYKEPGIIPLEDVTGNQDNVSDFRNVPWPEPKGNAPPASSGGLGVPMFQPNMPQFPNQFPNAQFPGMPGFQGPNMVPPNDWQSMMAGGMPGPMPPGAIPPGAMPPGVMPGGIMVPPENMMMTPDMFGVPNPMFQPVPDGFNMMDGMNMAPNMFPPDFNMSGVQGPANGNEFSGPGFRGAMRGRGAGGHWRGKGPGWDGPPRGRGGGPRGGRKTVCIYFQRKGSCRQGDNCAFLHPGVNCPY